MTDSDSDLDIKSALPMHGGFPKKNRSSPTEDLKKMTSRPQMKPSRTKIKTSIPQEKALPQSKPMVPKGKPMVPKDKPVVPKGKPMVPKDKPLVPQSKKMTTKLMIADALTELKTRKGVSFFAIKKFLTEKYEINTERANYLIKKSLKAGVEDKTFIQLKGIGASGSFKLAAAKEKKQKSNLKKTSAEQVKPKKKAEKVVKQVEFSMVENVKPEKINEKQPKPKVMKNASLKKKDPEKDNGGKKKMAKSTKGLLTPKKKPQRKSIGSLRKAPKMKPKAQA